jgi:hypothetical protein
MKSNSRYLVSHIVTIVTAAAITCLTVFMPAFAGGADIEERLIVKNVNLIPMSSGEVIASQTIIIRDGIIEQIIAASDDLNLPNAKIVNGTGKFLMPGLVDAHSHIATEAEYRQKILDGEITFADKDFELGSVHTYDEKILLQHLRAGVTTLLTLGSQQSMNDDALLNLRNLTSSGELLGPRIIVSKRINGYFMAVYGDGSYFEGESSVDRPLTAEHGRASVIAAKKSGYDAIKAYQFLNKETYTAVVNTARENGMRVYGHLPEVGCSTCVSPEYPFTEVKLDAIVHMEELARYAMGIMEDGLVPLDPASISKWASIFVDSGIHIIPNHLALRNIVQMYVQRSLPLDQKLERYTDSFTLYDWDDSRLRHLSADWRNQTGPNGESADVFPAYYDFSRLLSREIWKQGAPFAVGTDSQAIGGITYGFSVHEEMLELKNLGLSNLEVLQAATINAHVVLGEPGGGTLQEGRRADMLLLNSNPLEDIRNARDIAGVVANGRWLSMDDINAKTEVDINYWAEIDNQLGLQIDRAAPSMPSN